MYANDFRVQAVNRSAMGSKGINYIQMNEV